MIRIQKWGPFKFVIVITIMGILIAFILPQLIALSSEARIAVVEGMAGNLRSAIVITHGAYLTEGGNSNSIDLGGAIISLEKGYPVADGSQGGILGTLNGIITTDSSGNAGTMGRLKFSVGNKTVTLYPSSTENSATCNVTYTNDSGTTGTSTNKLGQVYTITSGC